MESAKKIRFFAESLALRLGLLIVPSLPRGMIRFLARTAGSIAYTCCRKLRRIALANLQIAFGESMPENKRREILAGFFHTTAMVMLDFLWFARNSEKKIAKYVRIDPTAKPHLTGTAMIGVTAHFGNWELISSASAAMGVQHAVVFADLKNPYVTPFLHKLRNAPGVTPVNKQGAIGKLLKALRRGQSIALLLDQNTLPQEGGIFVDFFGLPAPISNAAGLLAERTGVPVIVFFCMLQPDGTYLLYALPELKTSDSPEQDKPAERSAQDASHSITRAIANAFEQEITKHPEQWLWMYKRWKFIASGVAREAYPFYSRSF